MEHLIPEGLVHGLPQWQLLLVSAAAVLALGQGANWLVDGASGLAYRFGISKVIVGATVVSLGTTSPECAVSVMAAWAGEPGLALGNAIGSVIADSGLIFGLGCLLTVLPADRFVLSRQGWVQFGAGALLALLCYGAYLLSGDQATLERWVGLALLALLVVYLWVSIRWSRQHRHGEPFQMDDEEASERKIRVAAVRLVATLIAGLVLVLLSSRLMILSVTELAEVHWHVPKVVIASTLVALGTSMPELVIGLASIIKGHKEILVGNIIGADILNVLFVVGAAAAAAPLPILEPSARIPAILLYVHLPTMLAVLVLFRLFIFRASARGEFRRWYGVPLLLLYIGYTVVQYAIS
jgi:cation:H+ antiporter